MIGRGRVCPSSPTACTVTIWPASVGSVLRTLSAPSSLWVMVMPGSAIWNSVKRGVARAGSGGSASSSSDGSAVGGTGAPSLVTVRSGSTAASAARRTVLRAAVRSAASTRRSSAASCVCMASVSQLHAAGSLAAGRESTA